MHTIIYDQGAQTLRWAPVDPQGYVRRVSGAMYTIVDLREHDASSDREVQASTPATLDGTTWTLTAAAGPDQASPNRLTLDTVAGLERGRTLLLAGDATPHEEGIQVAGTNETALTVDLARDLVRTFASSSTLQLAELEATFPASVANDEDRLLNGGGPFQVSWIYTLDGVVTHTPQLIYITRYGISPWVSAEAVLRHFPTLAARVGQSAPPEAAIAAATDDAVGRMLASGRDPELLRGNFTAELAIRYKAVAYMLMWQKGQADIDLSDRFETGYERHMNNLLEGRPPNRTTTVDHDLNTAPAGTDPLSDGGIFQLS